MPTHSQGKEARRSRGQQQTKCSLSYYKLRLSVVRRGLCGSSERSMVALVSRLKGALPMRNGGRAAASNKRSIVCSSTSTSPALRKNPLGASGIMVTDVCMGTMTFGEQNTEREAHTLLSCAADHGVNFIDTAEIYPVPPRSETSGASSQMLGRWLATQQREKFVVATKVTGRSPDTNDWVPARRTVPEGPASFPRLDSKSIIAAAEGELRRLGTDHIDLLQLHWPDRYVPSFGRQQYRPELNIKDVVPFSEQVQAIGQLISQGKVRAWGLSNETSFGVMSHCAAAFALGVPPPVTVQNHYSLIQRTYEGDLAETCLNLGIGLLPWSPLAGGSLSGKYLGGQLPPGSRFQLFGERYARFNSDRVQRAVKRYAEIAHRAGMAPEQLAYAFCRSKWFVVSTIIGATTQEQLLSNLATFTGAGRGAAPGDVGIQLGEEVMRDIEAVHNELRNPALLD